ncbi:hypothetical protein [Breoghania sp.]|uniref:hypothetical protein n=1 Tax=Breoghania sp. TaxID=2065378 RepID=UPI0026141E7D|nr:hypothetical protein [Breoghania sp.]MDJ0932515.1 hypothetical protein [Breoghania sp.]
MAATGIEGMLACGLKVGKAAVGSAAGSAPAGGGRVFLHRASRNTVGEPRRRADGGLCVEHVLERLGLLQELAGLRAFGKQGFCLCRRAFRLGAEIGTVAVETIFELFERHDFHCTGVGGISDAVPTANNQPTSRVKVSPC